MKAKSLFKLTMIMCVSVFFTVPVSASMKQQELNTNYICSASIEGFDVGFEITSQSINTQNNQVIVLNNGIEIEYLDENNYTVKDKNNVFNADPDDISNSNGKFGWVLLGKVFMKIASGCSFIPYLTGYDLCRIALSYLSSQPHDSTYDVYMSKTATHVPGCYPSSSPNCTTYSYEYKFSRIG